MKGTIVNNRGSVCRSQLGQFGEHGIKGDLGIRVRPDALNGLNDSLSSADDAVQRPGRCQCLKPLLAVSVEQRHLPAGYSLRAQVADAIAAHCGEPRLDLVAAGPERPPSA